MQPQPDDARIKTACALVETGRARGTGFLVAPDLVLTCHHVIREAGERPIQVHFSHGVYQASVDLADVTNDCALLRLMRPVPQGDASPLQLTKHAIAKGSEWEGYGFPAATGLAGLLIGGRVQDPSGQDSAMRSALVLHSQSVTGGSHLGGFSGSPVLFEGRVIGQMRKVIPDQTGGAQMAVVYACPVSQLAALLVQRGGQTALQATNPYRGLAAFQQDEASLFFGREELTEKLWERFKKLYERPEGARLLAILGPSGSGKSSVARAGLLAALCKRPVPGPQAMQQLVIKPGEHPVRNLALALQPTPAAAPEIGAQRKLIEDLSQPNQKGAFDGLTLWAANSIGSETRPLVVLVDQFEELYTLCTDPAEREAFVGLLLHAAQDGARQVSVVLTLRSDFLGETHWQHPALNRLIAAQEVIVGVMSEDEMRRAIAEPAARSGYAIDDATTELLLRETKGNHGALPLLEFALTQIWEGMRTGKPAGTTLRMLGGVGGALAGKAQEIYASLSELQKTTARRAFVRLVQLGEGTQDTRRRAQLRELCGRGNTEAEVLSVLRRFAAQNARLVTLAGDGLESVAEVTHEALFEHWAELRQWIDENRGERRLYDRAAEAARLWDEAGRPSGRLWRPPDLDLLRDLQKRRPDEMSSLQAVYLAAAERQQKSEKFLRWGSVGAVMLAVLIATGIYIIKERQRAADATKASEQSRKQLLSSYIERGRQLLFVEQKPFEALLWLHRAQRAGAKEPVLLDLLRSALLSPEVPRLVLVGHRDSVTSVAYSPDGRRIVTASKDKTARVWETDTGRLVAELKGHRNDVMTAAFSPDGRHLVTASWDSTAKVWEADTGRLVAEHEGHWAGIFSAAYSPDGRRIVTASEDKTARVWEADTGRLVAELKGHEGHVVSAAYSPDGRRIVTASKDKTARVWEADTGRLVAELKGHRWSIASATYSPDGRRIATASLDSTARVWQADTGHLVAELKGHGYLVWSAAFSPDGQRIVTASGDSTARVWEADTGREHAKLKGHGGRVWSAAFSPDGRRIVTASEDKTATVWQADTGDLVAEFKSHGGAVRSAAFSPDGRRIVTASEDKTARVWEAGSGHLVAELKGHERSIVSATYSPDGHRFVTTSEDKTARVWESDSGQLVAELKGHGDGVWRAAYSPDGRRLVTASWDRTARVWEAGSGRLVAELKGHGDRVWSAAYSPDGRRIVTGSFDRTARVWEADTGRLVVELKGHADRVRSAAYSPDGRHISTASEDKTARVWEADSGHLVAELKGHRDALYEAQYSPDGRHLVTTSEDKTARVWASDSGDMVAELKGHGAGLWSAAYSPDGRRIVTASFDKTARVWEADTGRLVAELKGHEAGLWSAAYSPDGHRLVTASGDGTARVWEADSGRPVTELKRHGSRVMSAVYSPDGSRLLTVSLDNTARVWTVAPSIGDTEQVARLLRCYVPLRFESFDRDILVPTEIDPTECQNRPPASGL